MTLDLDGQKPAHDSVSNPTHYVSDPSGIECIQITRHRNYNIGNAIKYLWRAGLKQSGIRQPGQDSKQVEDLEKARWYIADEIERLRNEHYPQRTLMGAVIPDDAQ